MKNLILFTLVVLLSSQPALSQKTDHINGGHYTKKIEYNANSSQPWHDGSIPERIYNTYDKSLFEKMFFGFTNSPVEFFVAGTIGGGEAGLRLYKESSDNDDWTLEIVPHDNYGKEMAEVEKDIERIEIPWKYLAWLNPDTRGLLERNDWHVAGEIIGAVFPQIPLSVHEELNEYNIKAYNAERDEKTYTSRRPKTKTFTVTRLGDILYDKTVALISNFKAEGGEGIIDDGYFVTFRCVVGAEVWSLRIHCPENRPYQMYEACWQLIKDTDEESGSLDERKYIRMLKAIKF